MPNFPIHLKKKSLHVIYHGYTTKKQRGSIRPESMLNIGGEDLCKMPSFLPQWLLKEHMALEHRANPEANIRRLSTAFPIVQQCYCWVGGHANTKASATLVTKNLDIKFNFSKHQ